MPETNTTGSFSIGQAQATENLGPFFELAPYPIWVFDLETLALVAVNQAAIDHYGYSREEMLTMKVTDLMAPFEVTRLLATLDAVRHHEPLSRMGTFWRHCKKDKTTVDTDTVPHEIILGGRRCIAAFIHDITERKQAQEERERLLREWAEAEQEARRRLDTFLAVVTHELKTPLTVVIGMLDMLTILLEQQRDQAYETRSATFTIKRDPLTLLNRAQQQTALLARLINDLVDASRVQSDKLELRMQNCDLVNIVREKVEEQHDLAPMRTLHLDTLTVESTPVYADAERIGQVVTNYLSNALKYSSAEQPVDVWLQRDGQHVSVYVRDRGVGIAPEAREKIWERFYRIPGTQARTRAGVGLGLGLHISRTIIERHGGHVGVESKPGEGSTFWFTLSVAPSAR